MKCHVTPASSHCSQAALHETAFPLCSSTQVKLDKAVDSTTANGHSLIITFPWHGLDAREAPSSVKSSAGIFVTTIQSEWQSLLPDVCPNVVTFNDTRANFLPPF